MTAKYIGVLIIAALLAACAPETAPEREARGYELIAGSFVPGRGPDGNSLFLDAPEGLILIDTGRHPEHRDKLLAYAKERGRPIVAIVNTHWHLDHSTGNAEIRAAYPGAELYASNAIEGALTGFLPRSRQSVEKMLAAGQVPEKNLPEVRRAFAVQDNPDSLRPTRPVTASGPLEIAGRELQVNLTSYAATEGDVWIYDPATRTAFVGDLVVDLVPFMDTACPDGWRKALGDLAASPWTTLVPGHGAPMDRAQFGLWRAAFDNLIDCADSSRTDDECAAGWRRDAAPFVAGVEPQRIDGMTRYYLETPLRSPAGRKQYCAGGPG